MVDMGIQSLREFDVTPHFSMKVGNQDAERRWQKGEKNNFLRSSDRMLLNVCNPKILEYLHKTFIYTFSWKNILFCVSDSS